MTSMVTLAATADNAITNSPTMGPKVRNGWSHTVRAQKLQFPETMTADYFKNSAISSATRRSMVVLCRTRGLCGKLP
jgi:hypothetical protein